MGETLGNVETADQIVDHLQRTLNVISDINNKTSALLQKFETISGRGARELLPAGAATDSGRTLPAMAEKPVEASVTSDKPEVTDAPPQAILSTNKDALIARIVPIVVGKVVETIQPLLAALEKIRDEGRASQPKSDIEMISQLRDSMQQRVMRRKRIIPAIQK